MKYDAYTVAVVLATGAGVIAGLVVAGAAIGGGLWVAMNLEDWAQARNAARTKGMKP